MTAPTDASSPKAQPFPRDAWHLLRNSRAMAAAIAAVTSCDPEEARRRMWQEFVVRGSSVRKAGKALGMTPYVFDDAMAKLYGTSDAFVYELSVWNVNLLKRSIRSWVKGWVGKFLGPKQAVLTWGDGLGFDALSLAEAGHDVTFFDLPGYTNTFAQRMLEASGTRVERVTDPEALPEAAFDAIVCLDVLEHVPDMPAELDRLRRCLKPGGVLIVHAPFYFIHRVAITHLRANRRYSGSLAVFRKHGFKLIDGQPTWAPLVLARDDGPGPRRPLLAYLRLALALPCGLIYAIGRLTALPFEIINLFTRLTQMWYPDDMLGRGARRAVPPEDGPSAA